MRGRGKNENIRKRTPLIDANTFDIVNIFRAFFVHLNCLCERLKRIQSLKGSMKVFPEPFYLFIYFFRLFYCLFFFYRLFHSSIHSFIFYISMVGDQDIFFPVGCFLKICLAFSMQFEFLFILERNTIHLLLCMPSYLFLFIHIFICFFI